MNLFRTTTVLLILLGVLIATSCSSNKAPTFPYDGVDRHGAPLAGDSSDLITNGSFVNDTANWTFAKEGKKGNPSGSWDPSGYANGGAAKISSEIGKGKQGIGYWEQVIATQIQSGSSVRLSYAWKKGYSGAAPSVQDISIRLVKPDGRIVNIDEQEKSPPSYDEWFSVTEKDVSAYFDQTGTYTIRLRYRYRTGRNASAQAFAWFDEIELLVSSPIAHWGEKASTPYAGGYGESVASTGSHIYVIRELYASSAPHFWRYDPNTDSWVFLSIEGLPVGAFRNGTTLTWDNADYLYGLGGARYSDADRRVFYRYSISGDDWTQAADSPAPQGAGDAAAWSGYSNELYAILGSSQHGTTFADYDPSTNTWELLASCPAGTDDGASLAWTGGTSLYALRGEYHERKPLQDFWRYDIVNDSWTTLTPIPEEDGVGDGGSLIWIGNWNISQTDYVYALGGGAANEKPGYNFYRYLISDDTWETLPTIPYPVGYYNGNRLGFTSGYIHYWQGSPTSWLGGGNKFVQFAYW